MKNQKVVLFDICGTLFFSNTSFDFLDTVVSAKSYRVFRKFSKTIVARIINKLSVILLHKDLIRSIAVLYIKGFTKEELLKLADYFYDDYLSNKKIDSTFDLIISYLADKNIRVILASATFDFIAETVAKKIGVAEFFGTDLCYNAKSEFSGSISKDRLGHKHQALVDMGVQPPYFKVITDNVTDMDIINHSETLNLILYPWTEKKWIKQKSKVLAIIEDERKYNY